MADQTARVSLPDVEGHSLQRALSHWPVARDSIFETYGALFFDGALPVELKEQIRATLAGQGNCVLCASIGTNPLPADQQPSRRDQLAVGFAEVFVQDPTEVDASAIEVLKEDFSDAEIVELVTWCAIALQGQIIGAALGVPPATAEDSAAFIAWQEEGARA